jgi:hypothetical protein
VRRRAATNAERDADADLYGHPGSGLDADANQPASVDPNADGDQDAHFDQVGDGYEDTDDPRSANTNTRWRVVRR